MARVYYILGSTGIKVFAVVLLGWSLATPVAGGAADQSGVRVERVANSGNAGQAGKKKEFDLDALAERLRASTSIGVLTKLSLRNQVDDLIEAFRRFHAGERARPLSELRERFNFLLMKIISLVQDKEPELAKEVFSAREVLWGKLTDPKEFSKL
jgi:hypothetical protein